MLPELTGNQNVFIEITNPVHGGPGWEFGSRLWSPVRDKRGAEAWGIMKEVKIGDVVLHLLKEKQSEGYKWTGISIVKTDITTVIDEPPQPDQWKGMSPYQFIEISNFDKLPTPIPISSIFAKYEKEFRSIYREPKSKSFYIEYGFDKELRVAVKYMAHIPQKLYKIFQNISDDAKFDYNPLLNDGTEPTENEPAVPDYTKPARTLTMTNRIIRDTELVRKLKESYGWSCQICGKRILLPNGKYYTEGHHLRPLGGSYEGPDIAENIIILCPNHHAEFDLRSIAIDPETMIIEHIDDSNEYHGKSLAYSRSDLGKIFLEFHYDNLFNE
ncbi:MAG: HNH endonuclease [Thermoplasmata archaeon]|nr:HNH endonuclease [Thermoplasmata archaeon]